VHTLNRLQPASHGQTGRRALASPLRCGELTVLIPFHLLEADTLTRLIEDFVTRDGTDNGDETPLHTRIERVRHALGKGQAVIVFDPESQQCQLALRRDVPKEWLEELAE
jgi:uncharacterized protein YheU (UPF0270 family)